MAPKPKPRPKKVVIDYPPVKRRRWVPPWKPHVPTPFKRKPHKRLPIYPKTHKIKPSTLLKIWHQYKMISKKCAILYGIYSQNDPRFHIATRGKQGPANCFAAIGYTKMLEMEKWTYRSLNLILETGQKLYEISIKINKNTCSCTSPKEVHNTFYIETTQIVLKADNNAVTGCLRKRADSLLLLNEIPKMFKITNYCILEVDGYFFALWKNKGSYYVFDPNDRNFLGQKCREGTGVSVALKFINIPILVEDFLNNFPSFEAGFTLTPVFIKKFNNVDFTPPATLEEVLALIPKPPVKVPTRTCLVTKAPPEPPEEDKPATKIPPPGVQVDKKKPKKKGAKGKEEEPEKEEQPAPTSNTPSLTSLVDEERIKDKAALIPLEKPQAPSVTYFYTIVPEKSGIILASYHQDDPSYSKYHGKQSLANAVAAIAMLRQHKAKLWFPKILDEVLITGEIIYMDSRKFLGDDKLLTIPTIVDKIRLNRKFYTPEIEESTIIGKLNTTKLNILDLFPALEEFFSCNDTGI